MRRATSILAVAVAVVVAFALGLAAVGGGGGAPRGSSTLVDEVRGELASRYYRAVPPAVLRLRSVHQMLSALGDPYTEFLDPAQYRLLQRETAGTYSGVGMTLLPGTDGLLVTRLQHGPAQLAGIRPGDTVLAVDGVRTAQLTYEQALGRILGRAGSAVRLRVRRGPHTIQFTLLRTEFRTPAVSSRLLAAGGRKIGYVSLASFTAGSTQAVEWAIKRLERSGAEGLVLDLRGNPGGLLDRAVGVASLFLDKGVIASTQGVHEPERVYRAAGSGQKTRLPLAVLIDHGSASAAEVVAAALQDNRRALLVGEPSFGKALVQSIQPLAAGSALKLTIARYLTPAGTDLSRGGVRPDIRARDNPATAQDEGLAAALRALGR